MYSRAATACWPASTSPVLNEQERLACACVRASPAKPACSEMQSGQPNSGNLLEVDLLAYLKVERPTDRPTANQSVGQTLERTTRSVT